MKRFSEQFLIMELELYNVVIVIQLYCNRSAKNLHPLQKKYIVLYEGISSHYLKAENIIPSSFTVDFLLFRNFIWAPFLTCEENDIGSTVLKK